MDSADFPIAGAVVWLGRDSVLAARDGFFRFRTVTAAKARLLATYPGYHAAELELDPEPGSEVALRIVLARDRAVSAAIEAVDAAREAGVADRVIMGWVRDEEGTPLKDVQVLLGGTGRLTITRHDGRFAFTDVAGGPLLLTARRIGYLPAQRSIVMRDDSLIELDLVLRSLPAGLPPVVVQRQSGWGRAFFAIADLDRRLEARARVSSAVIPLAELSKVGRLPLDQALNWTPAAGMIRHSQGIDHRFTTSIVSRASVVQGAPDQRDACMLVNGERPMYAPLAMFAADQLQMVEVYLSGSEPTQTIASRLDVIPQCRSIGGRHPAYYVIWVK